MLSENDQEQIRRVVRHLLGVDIKITYLFRKSVYTTSKLNEVRLMIEIPREITDKITVGKHLNDRLRPVVPGKLSKVYIVDPITPKRPEHRMFRLLGMEIPKT